MGSSSPSFMVFVTVIVIVLAMVGVGWYWFHDLPAKSQKFSWHQLVRNSFNLTLIDDDYKTWVIDIFYNEDVTDPIYTVKGERKLLIQLPVGFEFKDFVELTKDLTDLNDNFSLLMDGVTQEKALRGLQFTRQDLSLYQEFKRHLLVKALKH